MKNCLQIFNYLRIIATLKCMLLMYIINIFPFDLRKNDELIDIFLHKIYCNNVI